jgi:hypothetical protein
MPTTKVSRFVFAALILFAVLTVGCGSPVTKANYDKVNTGMTLKEVQGILGSGTEQGSSGIDVPGMSMTGKAMVWQEGTKIITVQFINDKVVSKAQMGLQ